jgi:hypothetical protein
MPQSHDLAKAVWTHQDFEVMGWHDAHLYCFTVLPETFELLFDIDSIVKWVKPTPPEEYFKFWIAPATLVFDDAQNIKVLVEMGPLYELQILDISRTPVPDKPGDWHWLICLTAGEITFDATGYTQYFRKEPAFSEAQSLGLDRRGGVSFDRSAYGA